MICLLLAGCGGSKAAPAVDLGGSAGAAPSTDELKEALQAEFQRLGIDPSRAVAAAPTGQANAVFDLSAAVIDPDGEGGEPPTGIELKWTEQLQGDYDQNGLVNYSDLTPISQQWNEVVAYDDAALHGGFQWWPTGDPDDAEGGSPPPEGSAALNWRRARVDGHQDGLIELGDITPIAYHWLERLSGYRVYVKGPVDAGFSLHDAATTTRDNFVPVRYSYTLPVDASGLYGIYVSGFDDDSGGEGPASAAVYVDVDTGSVNHGPVASLSVAPGFAGAPAEITLDATASYDVDGSIAAYQWDFDGDGAVDWVSTEPVPEQSSGGTVELITPDADGVVTATYTQGSAEWLYPSVTVVDDQDAQSAAATAKLGISGWLMEVMDYLGEENTAVTPKALSIDPATGDVVVAGGGSCVLSGGERGFFFSRRAGVEQWEDELIILEEDLPWEEGEETPTLRIIRLDILWDECNQPVLLMHLWHEVPWFHTDKLFSAQRRSNGTWAVELRMDRLGTGDNYGADSSAPVQVGPGKFCALAWQYYKSWMEPDPNPVYLLWYDHGEWTLELQQGMYSQTSDTNKPLFIAAHPDGSIHGIVRTDPELPYTILWAKRQEDTTWVEGVLVAESQIGTTGERAHVDDLTFDHAGNPVFVLVRTLQSSSTYTYSYSLAMLENSSIEEHVFDDPNSNGLGHLNTFSEGFACFSGSSEELEGWEPIKSVNTNHYHRVIDGRYEVEEVTSVFSTNFNAAGGMSNPLTAEDGSAYGVLRVFDNAVGFDGQGEFFMARVDPRI